jgi:hypothetical protein
MIIEDYEAIGVRPLVKCSDVAVIFFEFHGALRWLRIVAVAMRTNKASETPEFHFTETHCPIAIKAAPPLI